MQCNNTGSVNRTMLIAVVVVVTACNPIQVAAAAVGNDNSYFAQARTANTGSRESHGDKRTLKILQSWDGEYPVAELKRLPEALQKGAAGYVGTATVFTSVWQAFRPGEDVPDVDFNEHIVVISRNLHFYNRTSIAKITLEDGVAEVIAIETMSAMPIEDMVAMAIAVIPRAGIRFIRTQGALIPVQPEREG